MSLKGGFKSFVLGKFGDLWFCVSFCLLFKDLCGVCCYYFVCFFVVDFYFVF